jgi:hypothetical protein
VASKDDNCFAFAAAAQEVGSEEQKRNAICDAYHILCGRRQTERRPKKEMQFVMSITDATYQISTMY